MSLSFDDICNLKVGDIIYEFYRSNGVKSEVVDPPDVDGDDVRFMSKIIGTDKVIHYHANKRGLHYLKLYDYRAYEGCWVEGEDDEKDN